MGTKLHNTVEPKLFWERYVVPHRMKQTASNEEKAWPEYIIYDKEAAAKEHEDKFTLRNTSSHDGNIINTYELIWSVFKPLVMMTVIANRYKGRKDYNGIRYTIGDIKIECEIDATIIMGDKRERGNIEVATLDVISEPFMKH